MKKHKSNLSELEEYLNYPFRNSQLLEQALTHTSYANESKTEDNERLEFLGDAVLELAVSHLLYLSFPQAEEGKLTKTRAFLVNEKSLARVAHKIKLGQFIRLGKGEEQQGGRKRESILADTLEAILGAIYLDSQDFFLTQKIVAHLLKPFWPKKVEELEEKKDYKTLLQELTQDRFGDRPIYTLVDSFGPDHAKTFKVKLTLPSKKFPEFFAQAPSIKKAEQQAAKKALFFLQKELNLKNKS